MSNHKVFVYGTLKKGFGNHRLLEGCKSKKAVAFGIDLHSGPGFPYAQKGEGSTYGELYEVNDDTLYRLDFLEGVPMHYQRESILVDTKDAKEKCWIYLSPNRAERYQKIESGVWKSK